VKCEVLEVREETRQDQRMGRPEIKLKCQTLRHDINFRHLYYVRGAKMHEYALCVQW
jgi:hypothetical protein